MFNLLSSILHHQLWSAFQESVHQSKNGHTGVVIFSTKSLIWCPLKSSLLLFHVLWILLERQPMTSLFQALQSATCPLHSFIFFRFGLSPLVQLTMNTHHSGMLFYKLRQVWCGFPHFSSVPVVMSSTTSSSGSHSDDVMCYCCSWVAYCEASCGNSFCNGRFEFWSGKLTDWCQTNAPIY